MCGIGLDLFRGARLGLRCWRGLLLGLGFIEERRFAGPALVGKLGQLSNLCLADQILLLFLYGRRMLSKVSEPLMPLC